MTQRKIIILKVITWMGCLEPALFLLYKFVQHDLTANPIEFVTLTTGTATLVLLLISLAITPLRKLSGLTWLIRFRRLFGLFAFFYGTLHLTTYVVLDKFFDWHAIFGDVTKRPFITVGFAAFVLMVPLAATSTAWSIRKLGGKRWNALHKLVYASAVLAIIHFWWKVKADHTEPAVYGSILAVLLLARVAIWTAAQSRKQAAASLAKD